MLYDAVPRSAPLTVMLPCPVVPMFLNPAPDAEPRSYDAPSVIVCVPIPAVTYVVRLPPTPAEALHATELSDTHSVASHIDAPS